jgi:nucleoside-diphosphate-sugar epimerase
MKPERKTAVLTGGFGYVGQHVAQCLIDQGWDLVLLARAGFNKRFSHGVTFVRVVEYDGSLDSLDALNIEGTQVVFFHLAASADLKNEAENCDKLFESNVRLGVHLLTYMCRHNVDKFIYAESYWQFDNCGTLGGNTLYASSKSAFSLLLEYYCRNSIRAISLVLYDVYGPNDKRNKLLNFVITNTLAKIPIDMTEGAQILDFIHVHDVARAFEIAGQALLDGRDSSTFKRHTVRSLQSLKLRDFIEILGNVINITPLVRWGVKPYPNYQIMRPWLPSEVWQLPGWMPEIPFNKGVKDLLKND